MKTLTRTTLVALLCLAATSLFAQLSDVHYLPPLKQKDGAFVQQAIYVSTPDTSSFEVKVYRGNSTSAVATLNVSNTSGGIYNPGDGNNGITLLTDANTGIVNSNAGLRFESEKGKKFYVNWRGRSGSQGSSLTSKGRAALGTAFKWVGVPNRGTQITALTNAVGIMATEDGTVVNIFGYNPNTTFRLGTNEEGLTADDITVTLDKGQTYVLESSVTTVNSPNRDGWLGASITSTKPIAVNFGQMHVQPKAVTGSRDAAIDQIIPENTLGKEYVLVRGRGIDSLEFALVVATQNNTQVFVNGGTTAIATLNNGDYFQVPSTYYSQSSPSSSVPGGNLYVRTSKEAYVVQSLAGDVSDATGDVNFIAPINCLLSNNVDNIPDVSVVAGTNISGGITVIASSAIALKDIKVMYGSQMVDTATLKAAKKSVAGNNDWYTYYLPGLTGNVKVNATGPIAVGYFGYQSVIGVSGYFSGFETIPTIEVERIGDGCLPSTILKATPGFTAYTWYRDGIIVPGVNSHTYTPTQAGKFTVMVSNGSCSYHSANQYIYDCRPEIIVNTTANKNGIRSGESVAFDISVRYLSDFNVQNLVLTNLVPANVTVTSTSATYGTVSNTGNSYVWNIGTMRNGEEHLLRINATGVNVASATVGTLTVTKTQTLVGTESNKVEDDFEETITVYPGLVAEPSSAPTGLYFTNTGSAHPFNNVLHFTPSADADGYLVVRRKSAAPDFVPQDGESYTTGTNGNNEIIFIGNKSEITDMSAVALVDYHYTIYPYKGGGSVSNYRTTNPLRAVINNRIENDFSMTQSSVSSSAGLARDGVNVTFINGVVSGGTTIAAEKYTNSRPANGSFGLPQGLNSVKSLYYTVTSSAANPGEYVIVLDFSGLGLSESDWNNARVVKRSGSGAAWEEVTSKIINRSTDGLLGKLTITNLSSFSDFAIGSTELLLPVTWLDFTVRAEAESVVLNWSTASELNAKDFVVQHSNSGLDWYDLGTIAAAGNSNTVQQYQYTHNEPVSGTNYYRLKQRDIDNRVSYSAIKKVNFTSADRRIVILGNPVTNNLLRVSLSESTVLSVKSLDGRNIVTKNLTAGRHQIELGNQPPGTYLLVAGTEVIKFMVR